MKPFLHSEISVKKFGGRVEDYLPLHNFMDSSKSSYPLNTHRAILHHSFGIFILEKVFGEVITNSDGKKVSVRDVGEQHCLDDLGFIPTVQDYLEHMEYQEWMGDPERKGKQKLKPLKIKPEEMVFDGSQPFIRPVAPEPFDDFKMPTLID